MARITDTATAKNSGGNNYRRGRSGSTAAADAGKSAPGKTREKPVVINEFKVSMPEDYTFNGKPCKFRTIGNLVQFSQLKHPSVSLNMTAIDELLEAGVIEITEKGYLQGVSVFTPYDDSADSN